jgi:hypothetical protein
LQSCCGHADNILDTGHVAIFIQINGSADFFLTWVKAAQTAGTPAKIKQGLATQLDGWISATEEGSFEGFAREPSPGFAAVHAALTLSWQSVDKVQSKHGRHNIWGLFPI